MRTRLPRLAWLAAVPVLAAGLVTVPAAGAAGTAACPVWNGSQPVFGQGTDELNAIAVVSACDVWAVGRHSDATGRNQALIEQWTGSSWAQSAVPALPYSRLRSVTAVSASNVWAVGDILDGSGVLILHWDGTSWTRDQVPALQDGPYYGLSAVDDVRPGRTRASGAHHELPAVQQRADRQQQPNGRPCPIQ